MQPELTGASTSIAQYLASVYITSLQRKGILQFHDVVLNITNDRSSPSMDFGRDMKEICLGSSNKDNSTPHLKIDGRS